MNTPSFSSSGFIAQLGHERGQQLFDALADVRFFIKDLNGVYQHASRVMLLAHGFHDASEIVGRTDHDFIPAYLADHYIRDDQQVLAGQEVWGRVELVLRHASHADWHITTKIPLRSPDGRVIGLAGMSRDMQLTANIASPLHWFAPVLDYIRDQLAEPIEIDRLARLVGMSPRSFQRHFKQTFQLTTTQYIRQFRIGKSCQMLVESDATITTIALEVGFSDHSHFSREFVRAMNQPPGAYRKRYQLPQRLPELL